MDRISIPFGNTPTHVGKTVSLLLVPSPDWKHPHARGEDSLIAVGKIRDYETPPRTWGRLWSSIRKPRECGNTPTHVGKTFTSPYSSRAPWKHPHARGEDALVVGVKLIKRETPPRTWGRLLSAFVVASGAGNTPTHVGKTCCFCCFRYRHGKHPHARGEDGCLVFDECGTWETPPRTWGRPPLGVSNRAIRRNTPTHVGKTHQQLSK